MSDLEPTGCLFNESNELYHSRKAISFSKLKVADNSLEVFNAQYVEKTMPGMVSEAMNFGTHAHTLILEGEEEFNNQYAVLPEENFKLNSNEGKSNYADFISNALTDGRLTEEDGNWMSDFIYMKGRTEDDKKKALRIMGANFVKFSDHQEILKLKASIDSKSKAKELLRHCQAEATFRTNMTGYGFQMQCRADGYSPTGCDLTEGESYVVDLKTIDDVDNIGNKMRNFSYFRQGAFYQSVIDFIDPNEPLKRFCFIFVEKKAPYRCRQVIVKTETLDGAATRNKQDLLKLSNAYRDNDWADPFTIYFGLSDYELKKLTGDFE